MNSLLVPLTKGTNAEIVHSALMHVGFMSKYEIGKMVENTMNTNSIAPTLTALREHGLVEWRRIGTKQYEFLAHPQDHPIPPQDPIVKTYTKDVPQRIVEEPYHKASDSQTELELEAVTTLDEPEPSDLRRTSTVISDEILALLVELGEVQLREIDEARTACVHEFEEFINSKRGK